MINLTFSTGFANAVLDTGSVKNTFEGGFIKVYSGTPPTTADDAIPNGCTLLCTYSGPNDAGLLLAASAVGGAISKDGTQVWSGTAPNTGTASFWRYVQTGDSGAASTTAKRIQGAMSATGGTSGVVPSLTYTSGNTYTINYFSIPLFGSGY